jgi:hypothetical protein
MPHIPFWYASLLICILEVPLSNPGLAANNLTEIIRGFP